MTNVFYIRRDDVRQRQRLLVASALLGLAALLDIPLLVLAAPGNINLVLLASVTVLVSTLVFFLGKIHKVVLGGWLLSILLLAAVLIALPLDSLTKPIALVYVLPMLVGGWVVSSSAVLFSGAISTIILGGRLLFQNHNLDIQPAVVIVILSIITGLLWIILRDLEVSLAKSYEATEQAELLRAEATDQYSKATAATEDLLKAYAQQHDLLETIQALETPIMPLNEILLIVPVIGHIDTTRAQAISDRVLNEVHNRRSSFVIIDISGVAVVDTHVAQHIINLTLALKLLGASVIVTGITPGIAETMARLDISFGEAETAGSLSEGYARLSQKKEIWHRN